MTDNIFRATMTFDVTAPDEEQAASLAWEAAAMVEEYQSCTNPKVTTITKVTHVDLFGNSWPDINPDETCPTCGQPDNVGECSHDRLSDADVRTLGGIPETKEITTPHSHQYPDRMD